MSKPLPYFQPLSAATFLIVTMVFLFKSGIMIRCGDTAWHIAAGSYIRTHGIPSHDPWAFTTRGVPWFNLSWLWDVGISWLHDWNNNFYCPFIWTVLINASVLTLMVSFIRERGVRFVATVFVAFFALMPYSYGIGIRPQQMTFLCSILFFCTLHNELQKPGLAKYSLPLLMVLWANTHGGFISGLLIIGTFLFEAIFSKKVQQIKSLIFVGALTACATFLTPLGISIYGGAMRTLQSPMLPYISEWHPLEFRMEYKWFITYYILYGILLLPRLQKQFIFSAEIILSLLWCVLSIHSVRHVPLFVIFSAPFMAQSIDIILSSARYPFKARLLTKQAGVEKDLQSEKAAKYLSLCCMLFTLFLFGGAGKKFVTLDFAFQSDYIGEAIDYFVENYPGTKVFNDYYSGGCIVYKARGKLQHFIDGRADTAFSRETVEEYLAVSRCEPGWQDIFKKYQIDSVLLPNNHSAFQCLESSLGWNQVYRDHAATVLVAP